MTRTNIRSPTHPVAPVLRGGRALEHLEVKDVEVYPGWKVRAAASSPDLLIVQHLCGAWDSLAFNVMPLKATSNVRC